MGITNDGLSYWQAESEGVELLNTTIGDFFDHQAQAIPEREAIVYSGWHADGRGMETATLS